MASPALVPPAVVPPVQPPPHPQSRPVGPVPQSRAPSSRTAAAAKAHTRIAKASARLQKDSDKDTDSSNKNEISKHVSFKDQGEITHILGIEVICDHAARTTSFSHRRYIDSMPKIFSLEDTNPVQKVPRFAANPGYNHWTAVKRILRYLKGTRNIVLTVGGKLEASVPHASCDGDFANLPDHGRSVSGYAIMLGNSVFSWPAKKQTATALSTSEAEYYAGTHVGLEILWLRELIAEIGFPPNGPTCLHIDNTSTIRMITKSDEATHRTKYIRLSYHWIHEFVCDGHLSPIYVKTTENLADIFTKLLPADSHWRLAEKLGLREKADAN
jgi:hypothetical protein